MKKHLILFLLFFNSFILSANLYFDYPREGDTFYSNSDGYAIINFRLLNPSSWYYDLGNFETKLFYPDGSSSAWRIGQVGTYEVTKAGTYKIWGRVKVKHDLGGQGNYYLYSQVIKVYVIDNTSPAIPNNFTVSDPMNNFPILNWNGNIERDISGYLINKKLTLSGGITYNSTFSITTNSFIDSNFISNYKTGVDQVEYWIQAKDINGNLSNETIHIIVDGTSLYVWKNIINTENSLPIYFDLFQNYPNPFNPSTEIKFSIPSSGFVNLSVFNSLGQKVYTLIDEIKEAGIYSTIFDGSNLASGIYITTLKFQDKVMSRKMNLIK